MKHLRVSPVPHLLRLATVLTAASLPLTGCGGGGGGGGGANSSTTPGNNGGGNNSNNGFALTSIRVFGGTDTDATVSIDGISDQDGLNDDSFSIQLDAQRRFNRQNFHHHRRKCRRQKGLCYLRSAY